MGGKIKRIGHQPVVHCGSRGKRPADRVVPITRQRAYAMIVATGKRAGVTARTTDGSVRQVYPHAFRHGRVYDLVKKGVSPLEVATALGHANLNTIMSYFHPTEDDMRRVYES